MGDRSIERAVEGIMMVELAASVMAIFFNWGFFVVLLCWVALAATGLYWLTLYQARKRRHEGGHK